MTVKTHGVTGIALGLTIAGATLPQYVNIATSHDNLVTIGTMAAIILGTFAGAMYPDFDNDSSMLYADEVYVSWKSKLSHRGVTHTLFNTIGVVNPFIIIFALLKAFVSWNPKWVLTLGASFCIGCLFHIIEDTFTTKGVMWAYPITSSRYKIPLVKNYFDELVFGTIVTVGLLVATVFFWTINSPMPT